MILRSRGGDVARTRADAFGFDSGGVPAYPSAFLPAGAPLPSSAGIPVGAANVVGLPAVAAAIRLVSETAASLDLNVYRGRRDRKRLADDTWQFRLLRNPNEYVSGFDFVSDVMASVETTGNAVIWKIRNQNRLAENRILQLLLLDPAYVSIRFNWKTGENIYRFSGVWPHVELSPADVIHVRGFTVGNSHIGLSPIALHRHRLGAIIALDEYIGRFFSQGAQPGGVIKVPGDLTQKEADLLAEKFMRRHQGLNSWHRPAVLVNGADWVAMGMSLEDAQYVQAKQLTVEEIAQMWRVPSSLLEMGTTTRGVTRTPEQEFLRFHLSLLPRLRRFEAAFLRDMELFPDRHDPYPEFDTGNLLRTDAATRAEVALRQIQSGQRVPDEVRADDGLAPLDEINPELPKGIGKIPQIVPVGGSPHGVPEPSGLPAPHPEDAFDTQQA
jgi:HK97 family phage portal protein